MDISDNKPTRATSTSRKSAKSLEELRARTQTMQEPDLSSRLIRQVSIYLTWLLIQSPITANQVTFLFLVVGLAGAFLLGVGKYPWTVVGVLLLQLHILLDYSDGEVARYKGTTSELGHFLDLNFHLVVHAAIFTGLAWQVFTFYRRAPVIIGLAASAITFALSNRNLKAIVLRLNVKSTESVTYAYRDATSSLRQGRRLMFLVEEIFFGYRGFVFVVLLLGSLFQRLDVVLFFYGVTLPIYYLVKAVLVWRSVSET